MQILCGQIIGLIGLTLTSIAGFASEGLWTPGQLPTEQLSEQFHFVPSDEWSERVMRASVRVLPGCSGAMVSDTGLVLTNHHCVRRCIQALSTSRRNLIVKGFIAADRRKELACPNVEIDQLLQIKDVSESVKAAVAGKSGEQFTEAYNVATSQLTGDCVNSSSDSYLRCDVVSLFHGGRYFLYKYHRYVDVRLVWAPEFSIAFFGGDPDNFNFPRFNLDAAILRVYENGHALSGNDYLKINSRSNVAGDVMITAGYPGSTQRELTTDQLETLRDVNLIRQLILGSELRGVLEQYSKGGIENARIVANDLFTTENQLKRAHGRLLALQNKSLFDNKLAAEQQLIQFINQHPDLSNARNAWGEIKQAQHTHRTISNEYYFLEQEKGFLSTYFNFARILVRKAVEHSKPEPQRLAEYTDEALPALELSLFSDAPIYPELEKVKLVWSLTKMREWLGVDHPAVKRVFGNQTAELLASRWINQTQLGRLELRKLFWKSPDMVLQSNDPFIQLAMAIEPESRAVRRKYQLEVESVEQRAGQSIAEARFAMTGTHVYPDATFTLRLSFGEVKGWKEADRYIEPFTTIGGVFARDTGSEPFALPRSWINAKSQLNGDTPFNFVTDNDIIGGNSGSPIINRNAELVGLIFDGNIHSLGGSFGFDENVNRAVAVHPAVLLQALKVIYKADALLKELNAM